MCILAAVLPVQSVVNSFQVFWLLFCRFRQSPSCSAYLFALVPINACFTFEKKLCLVNVLTQLHRDTSIKITSVKRHVLTKDLQENRC